MANASGSVSARAASSAHSVRENSGSAPRSAERPQSAPLPESPKVDPKAMETTDRLRRSLLKIGFSREVAKAVAEEPAEMPNPKAEIAETQAPAAASGAGIDPARQYAEDYLAYQLNLRMQVVLSHEDPTKRTEIPMPGDSIGSYTILRNSVVRHIMQIYTDHEAQEASPYRRLPDESTMQSREERIRATVQNDITQMLRHVYEGVVELTPTRPEIPDGIHTAAITKRMDTILGDIIPTGFHPTSRPSSGIQQPPMHFG